MKCWRSSIFCSNFWLLLSHCGSFSYGKHWDKRWCFIWHCVRLPLNCPGWVGSGSWFSKIMRGMCTNWHCVESERELADWLVSVRGARGQKSAHNAHEEPENEVHLRVARSCKREIAILLLPNNRGGERGKWTVVGLSMKSLEAESVFGTNSFACSAIRRRS